MEAMQGNTPTHKRCRAAGIAMTGGWSMTKQIKNIELKWVMASSLVNTPIPTENGMFELNVEIVHAKFHPCTGRSRNPPWRTKLYIIDLKPSQQTLTGEKASKITKRPSLGRTRTLRSRVESLGDPRGYVRIRLIRVELDGRRVVSDQGKPKESRINGADGAAEGVRTGFAEGRAWHDFMAKAVLNMGGSGVQFTFTFLRHRRLLILGSATDREDGTQA
ncbi:hypothetical protein OBBRIDRAFT_805687 [Obba rivulosa]|uniref:Uncharacterized protein n=1 Tax=Obba rivulosa TaxID=1052685 RepID=A0A8E2AWL0_9APHY|nr:hypothetical protein OBBRIDRAFT_805687 [Obba rivulosa]